jgi:hypothetical protein
MKKIAFTFVAISFLTACYSDSSNKNIQESQDFFTYNQKTGVLLIDLDSLKDELNQVVLSKQSQNQRQNYIIKKGLLSRLENIKKVRGNNDYVNTWMEFDRQGNVIYDQSYYFETFLSQEDSNIFVECFLNNSFFNDKIYAVVGDYSKEFILKSNKNTDTIYFDKNEKKITIPIKKWKEGKNHLRFILYDDSNVNGVIKRRVSYVDKEFQIQSLDSIPSEK